MKRFLPVFFSIGICLAIAAAPLSAGDTAITLIYTGNQQGALDSCDCPQKPNGGLARLAPHIASIHQTIPDSAVIGTGDFFPGRHDALLQESCLAMLPLVPWHALMMGPYELMAPDSTHAVLSKTLPFMPTNAFPAVTATPYRSVRIGKMNCAVFGIIDRSLLSNTTRSDDPVLFARNAARKAKSTHALAIGVVHGPQSLAAEIARQVPEIDVLLCAQLPANTIPAMRLGKSIIACGSPDGSSLNILTLTVNTGNTITAYSERMIPIERTMPMPPAAQTIIDRYNAALRKTAQELVR